MEDQRSDTFRAFPVTTLLPAGMGTRPAVAGIAIEPHCAPATLSVLPSARKNCRPLFRLVVRVPPSKPRSIVESKKGKYRSFVNM